LSFPLNYWNALGCWAAMTVALTLPWSAHARRWPVRGAALAGTCLAASVAYLTYSRSAATGVVIAAAAVLALFRHRWLVAVHVAAAAAGTAAVILAIRSEPAIARGTGGAGGATVALVAVVALAACVLVAWATTRAGLERLRISPSRTRVALAVGAVAVLLGAVTVGPALANRAWRSFEEPTPALTATRRSALRRSPARGALLVFCVSVGVDWVWESTAVAAMALAAGTVVAGAGSARAPRRPIARRVPLAAGALLVVAIQLPVLGAATQIRAGQRAAGRGDVEGRWSTRPTPSRSRRGRRAATSSVRWCSSAWRWRRAPPPTRVVPSGASRRTGSTGSSWPASRPSGATCARQWPRHAGQPRSTRRRRCSGPRSDLRRHCSHGSW
jgi:hypothetical protein